MDRNSPEGSSIVDFSHYLGLVFCIIAATISWYLGFRLYKRYTENKSKSVLYVGFTFIFGGNAAFFIGWERLFLALSFPDIYSILTNIIGLYCAGLSLLFQSLFANHSMIPKYKKIFPFISTSLVLICFIGGLIFPPSVNVLTYEMVWSSQSLLIIVFTLGIVMVSNILIVTYYWYSIKNESAPHAKTAFGLIIAAILYFVVISIELVINNAILANSLRILYPLTPILFFIAFTRFIEVDWPTKTIHLYVIFLEKGICLYDYSFVGKVKLESQLVGGGISGITELLQEITHSSQRLRLLDQGDLKVLLEYGNYTMGALIVKENFDILRKKLKKFIEILEKKFTPELVRFMEIGELSNFDPATELVEQIFFYEQQADLNKIRF